MKILGGLRPPKPSRRQAMFTSVIRAAAPHNDTMNMGFSWEG